MYSSLLKGTLEIDVWLATATRGRFEGSNRLKWSKASIFEQYYAYKALLSAFVDSGRVRVRTRS